MAKTVSNSKIRSKLRNLRRKIQTFRAQHIHLHKSFQRSYREDYIRKTDTPGLLNHSVTTFRLIFKQWRTFLSFIIIMVVCYILLVGLMSESFYQEYQNVVDETVAEQGITQIGNFARAGLLLLSTVTSGGLTAGSDDANSIFMVLLFLIMWLVTIFLWRHFLSGEKPKLRDGLYNALSPLISTFLVFVVIFIQAIPMLLVVITYNAAVSTGFLDTPFYALVYFVFAALMILISLYLFSSSIIALVAVAAPGVYPLTALFAASDLMAGRRMKFLLRLVFLIIVISLTYLVFMMPVILLDLWFKNTLGWFEGVPIVPFFLLFTTCFVFIYATTYFYRYYRWLIDYEEK